MNPEQTLAKLAEVYATCPTYRDAGRVVTRTLGQQGQLPHESVKPFTTAFARPDRFRFEYRHRYKVEEEWKRYIVWADGLEVRTWWAIRHEVERSESLGSALAGATGVSGGSAHTVPSLLMPDRVGGLRLTEPVEVKSLGDESLGDVSCYRLSVRFAPPAVDAAEEERLREQSIHISGRTPEKAEHAPLTLWVDRGSMLIRRIEWEFRFETFRTETTTEYDPAIGATISDEELQFGAPAEKIA